MESDFNAQQLNFSLSVSDNIGVCSRTLGHDSDKSTTITQTSHRTNMTIQLSCKYEGLFRLGIML